MKHVLLINGNPDPSPEKLTSALAKAYREGAEEAGCTVRQINVGGIDFPWLHNAREFATEPTDRTITERGMRFLPPTIWSLSIRYGLVRPRPCSRPIWSRWRAANSYWAKAMAAFPAAG